MKRFTFEMLLAGTLVIGPAAFAQNNPASDSTGRDPSTGSSSTGSVPVPSQRRERNTTPTPATPDDPERNGKTGYPPGAQSPDTTKPYQPGPTDTTHPYGGSRTDTDQNRPTPSPTPTDDTNSPTGRPGQAPGNVGGTTTSGTMGTPGATPSGTTATDTPSVNPATVTAGAEGDTDTIAKVHQANQKEVEMAQMALDKANSAKVKAYARKLLNDHQAADKKLMTYAEKKGVDLSKAEAKSAGNAPGATTAAGTSATAGSANASDEAHRRLQSATGADFDREFVNVMLDEHDKAIDLVKSARDSVTDKQLRSQLGAMLPKLEQHRKMARDLADKQSRS
jgi:putative membrane protein